MSDQRDLADELYALWAKTTHAETGEWKITKDDKAVLVDIESEDKDGWEQTIGFSAYEYDAEFIVTVHTALPQLIRSLHNAWDEADRLDRDMDIFQGRLASAEMRVDELTFEVEDWKAAYGKAMCLVDDVKFDLAEELASVAALQAEVATLKADLEGLIVG